MLKVKGVFGTILTADLMTGQRMPEHQKLKNSGDGFKEIFDKECERIGGLNEKRKQDDPDVSQGLEARR